jgi:two-component system chemotaxis sensor kinase CheA
VQSEAGPVAIGVDRVQGARHEIIRPLPSGAGALPLLTGACFDPDGNPRLVFDPRGLAEVVRRAEAPLPDSKNESRLPILIVDDSVTTRMLEQTILEANGYEVDFAVSGEEAFQKVRKRRYGLMLVDVEMPGMNGFEVLEKARLDPELRNVPAILVTTRNSPDDRRRGMEAGARAYLLKTDFDEGLLLQTIRGLIG